MYLQPTISLATSTVCHLHSQVKENDHLNKEKVWAPFAKSWLLLFNNPTTNNLCKKRGLETYMSFEGVYLRSISIFDFCLKYFANFNNSYVSLQHI